MRKSKLEKKVPRNFKPDLNLQWQKLKEELISRIIKGCQQQREKGKQELFKNCKKLKLHGTKGRE